jgi:Protein of unknown function (DUF1553)/Protein of unknown function (DUF1549)/Planctomycete cytochrome C
MKFAYPVRVLSLFALIVFGSARAADAPAPAIRFSRDILPILSENCFQCHGPDEKARKAKLRLDTHEGVLGVVTPRKSDDSKLYLRITSAPEQGVMPPAKTNRKLSKAQKELLRRWIDEGAVWGKHWAYETPVRPELPAVKTKAWLRNGIDPFILARLEQEGLSPSAEAAKETLIRRVTLDLTGLPPTFAEIDAFLNDTSADAYEKVVDRLLQSPRYGERMAMDWLDDARYADTNGFQNDFARTMWPWRDWVINAYNRNQPFDRFLVEQMAGDLLPNATREQKIATGFHRNNRTVTEAGSIDEEWRVENAVDRVETTAMVFLGLTMGCARCHDHKFDPISQREFYQFYAFFNSVNEKGVYTETRGNVPPLVSTASREEEEQLKQLTKAVADANRELLQITARARVFPVETAAKLRQAKNKIDKLRKEKTELEKRIPSVMVMEDLKTPRETFVLKRGRYDMPDKSQKVEPGVPVCLPPLPADAPRNRLGLAKWLVDPANPLTARVTMNRFWQHYFGVGLVKTAENFGVQGERPSHPDLLDWLATEFMRSGWDVKAMQRLLVTSAAYRQTSNASPPLLQHDPENRLLARGPRFRLPAEAVRDNALAIGGLLVEKIGGPSIKPYQPARLWEELAGGAGEGPYVQDKGANLYRRSLYIYRKRTVPHPAMATFDAPSREVCQVKRARTNTPLQALELLNDTTYVEAARNLGQRMLTDGGKTPEERITFAFQRATARKPSEAELQILLRGLERYRQKFSADKDAAQKFLRHGDTSSDPKLDAVELAAYMATASVILNLDETITKE